MSGGPEGAGAGAQGPNPTRLLGRVLDDRFELTSILGVGGMGTVYRAKQFSMHRDVAVKVLRSDIAGDDFAVRRFLTEAQATSRLRNPHTVTAFDFGRTDDGILYLAMELMQGRTLAKVLMDQGKPFGLVRATRLINQVLDSVQEAHALGILHRDLKPDNVFMLEGVGSEDFLKVLDFGVAKMVGETRSIQTVAGISFGTPAYMSPEQMAGRVVGPGADIYSIAVMLFELLAGRPPLDEINTVQMAMLKLAGTLPRLKDVYPGAETRDDLDAFLARALDPDPARRPADVKAFREELNRIVRDATTGFRPEPTPPKPDPAPPPVKATVMGIPVVRLPEPVPAPPVARPVTPPVPPDPRVRYRTVVGIPQVASKPGRAERRSGTRTAHLSAVTCILDGRRRRALLGDISQAGAFLHAQWRPEVGQDLDVMLQLSEHDPGAPFILWSRVIRVAEAEHGQSGMRGFSVKWMVVRTQGPLLRLRTFFLTLLGTDFPCTLPDEANARSWEYRFAEAELVRDGHPVSCTDPRASHR